MQKRKLNKKAQALKLVETFFVTLFIILLFGIIIVFGVAKLRDTADATTKLTTSFTNVTTASVVNGSGTNVTGSTGLRNCVLSANTVSYNATNTTCSAGINAGNYTVSGCTISFKGNGSDGQDSSCYNNTIWNVTGSYSFNDKDITDATQNLSKGVSEFGKNASTYFAILAIILIIAILGILVAYALGFTGFRSSGSSANVGGGGGGSGGIISGRSSFKRGSDSTMSGI